MDNNEADEDLRLAIKGISDGRSLLFLGAGFSHDAKNAQNAPLPLGGGLAKILAEELQEDPDTDLDIIADMYVDQRSSTELLETVRRTFKATQTTKSQHDIVTAPWRVIYTTNYDDIVPNTLAEAGIEFQLVTRTESPNRASRVNLQCVHLNGSIQKTTQKNFDEEILLTSTHYFTNALSDSPWAQRLRADINISRSIFFVGYSMYDFDVSKVIFESKFSNKKIYFIQHEKLKRPALNRLSRFGKVYTIGLDNFAGLLTKEADRSENTKEPPILVNLVEVAPLETAPKQPRDEEVNALLFEGTVSRELIAWNSIHNTDDYGIVRDVSPDIAMYLENPGAIVLLHGDIGNGKGYISADQENRMSNAGYRVFRHDPVSDDTGDDILYLETLVDPHVVVIHDIFDNLEFLLSIRNTIGKSARILATSRSAVYELRGDELRQSLNSQFVEYDINTLSDSEIERLAKHLDAYGMWGDYSANSVKWKRRFIREECGRNLRSLLLDLFKQPTLTSKIRSLVKNLRDTDRVIYDGFLNLISISATDFKLSFKAMSEILGLKFAQRFVKRDEEWIPELFAVQSGKHLTKSPILCQFLLREIISDAELIETISNLAYRLDQLSVGNDLFRRSQRELLRFRFIERLLSNQQKTEKLVRFYEAVRRYGVGERNPQFWLQYAIARMSFKDYKNASQYFDTSFALAEGMRSYDDYQIKNQFARFLLESRYYAETYDDKVDAFFRANQILEDQMSLRRNGYYPYRVASQYLNYVEKFVDEFSSEELFEVEKVSSRILSTIDGLPPVLLKHRYVHRCRLNMRDLLDFIDA